MSNNPITQDESEQERWLPCHEYEDIYEVSSFGKVRRTKKARGSRIGFLISHGQGRGGYPVVRLCRNKTSRTCYVHRLVALTFIGPCPERMEVNHKDRNRQNPTLANLEYLTRSDNMKHSYLNGAVSVKGEDKLSAKLTESKIREIRASAEGPRALGRLFGVCHNTIRNIVSRNKWKHVV